MGKRILFGLVIVVAAVFGWHVYLSQSISDRVNSQQAGEASGMEMSVSVNPFTNMVSVTMTQPSASESDNPFAALGHALGSALGQAVLQPVIERELNTQAREYFDVYSMLLPYRVRVVTE